METTISSLWFRNIIRIREKQMEKAVDMKCRMGLYRGLKGLGYPYIRSLSVGAPNVRIVVV